MRVKRWDEILTVEDTNAILRGLATWHTTQIIASEVRLHLALLLEPDNLSLLCDYDPDYSALSASDAGHVRQILAFFTKRSDIDLGFDREVEAYNSFVSSERLCRQTNTIIKSWREGKFQFPPDVDAVFHRAQRKIAEVLGDVPSLAELKPRFGPGATTQVIKRNASARAKLGQVFNCSEELLSVANNCIEEMPGWLRGRVLWSGAGSASVPVTVVTGKLRFVAKNAKTHRAIVVEPMLNSMYQLAIGDFITGRLRLAGLDLKTGQARNQSLARIGSLTGALATLDLSSASDTIARELIYFLLPIDWALFLEQFRTGTIEYNGGLFKLQKFSSMGNGFTFPLETLIFWALAESSSAKKDWKNVTSYGDDIIVPTEAAPLLTRVLTSAGFTLNMSKSFVSGPFRESCGKDYLSGIDIRPCYIKDSLSGSSLFVLHNFYVRNFEEQAARIVLESINEPLRLWGPDGFGDGHLLGDWTPRPHRRELPEDKKIPGGWAGYTFDTYKHKGRKSYDPYLGDHVYPCYSIYASGSEAPLADDLYHQMPLPIGYWRSGFQRKKGWDYLRVVKDLVDVPSLPVDRETGVFGVTLPGTKGYKKVSIYTLTV